MIGFLAINNRNVRQNKMLMINSQIQIIYNEQNRDVNFTGGASSSIR